MYKILKRNRKENKMSHEDLGKILGVTKVSVSGYENGTRIPSLDVLHGILDVFRVSADYLMGRELNVVCEDNSALNISLSSSDIEIIRELRRNPELFNDVANNPKRFFSLLDKKRI